MGELSLMQVSSAEAASRYTVKVYDPDGECFTVEKQVVVTSNFESDAAFFEETCKQLDAYVCASYSLCIKKVEGDVVSMRVRGSTDEWERCPHAELSLMQVSSAEAASQYTVKVYDPDGECFTMEKQVVVTSNFETDAAFFQDTCKQLDAYVCASYSLCIKKVEGNVVSMRVRGSTDEWERCPHAELSLMQVSSAEAASRYTVKVYDP